MLKSFISFALVAFYLPTLALGQAKSVSSAGNLERATTLAESGQCAEALPLLRKTIRLTTDKELQKRAGLDGLHCAMTHNFPYDSLTFLELLAREFPRDPEVLYASTHAYSDLSLLTSQQLAREAPFSYQ